MKIKPLVWAEFPNGSGHLAVTPINTTYSICILETKNAKFCTLHFNGVLLHPYPDMDAAKSIAADHHRKHLMACFEDAES